MTDDLVSPFAEDADLDAEASVRPRRLADFIAQHRVRDQLELLLKGAMGRGTPPDHILLSGPPGLGKPVSVDALVLMGDGTRRRLGDIVVGDAVITRTGAPALVEAVHEQGELDTVRIRTASGREVVAAPDHPFWTTAGWVKAGDLTPEHVLAEVLTPAVVPSATETEDEFRRAGRAATAAVPEFVLRGDAGRIGAFLLGFFAGEDDREGPRELLEGAQHLLLRIGVRSRLAPQPAGSWRLTQLSGADGGPLAADPVVSAAPAGLHECRCLTVADDHTFTVNDLVVHNTTLANIVAAELGTGIRTTSGPVIERSGDLAAILTSLAEGDVLFIDEIHRIAKPAEELLYSAMEDFRVDVVVGKGPGATAIPLDVEPFTLVGATTRAGLLSGPMRDRFGFVAHLDFYSPADLDALLHRSARILGVPITAEGAAEIAGRSRGTPRIANRLLRRVRDYAEVRADGVVDEETAKAALTVYDVDQLGLDRLDRAVLRALIESFRGGPVGLSTLAVAVGEQSDTVEEMCEPFLVRAGLLARTPRGRVATDAGWHHLGKNPPEGRGVPMQQPDLFTRAEE
ncbi:Holliday junction DNA helicase RuvB [Actinoplanes sp. N902-109]|nr:Holliday junction DNA helicase RuvB [Actinoplanes sp. N902-109]